MKKQLLILVILICGISAIRLNAQSDSYYSLFEYAQGIYNPGSAGSNNAMCVTSLHRQQWTGLKEGRPKVTVFSFDMPMIGMDNLGVGLNINQDIIGFQQDINVGANVAFRTELDPGMLGIGLGINFINRSINGDWITWESLNGQTVYIDPSIPHMESKTAFDLSFGATLVGENFWVGLSATHLTKPKINYDIEAPSYIARHYYLTGGYDYSLPNPSFDLIGSGFIISDGGMPTATLNLKLLYNKSFWGGVSLRYSDAIVPMVGIHLLNGISIGYSYDIVLSKIGSYQYGSHEIMIRYCFNVSGGKTAGRYRSVRRL